METFSVRILHSRKRLGIKGIEAPSIDVAEASLIEILCDYLNPFLSRSSDTLKKSVYVIKDKQIRKLFLFMQIQANAQPEKFTLEICRKGFVE
jgi:hypothetical protein